MSLTEKLLIVDYGSITFERLTDYQRYNIQTTTYDSLPNWLQKEGHFKDHEAAKVRLVCDSLGELRAVNVLLIRQRPSLAKDELAKLKARDGFEVRADALMQLWLNDWHRATFATKVEVVGRDFSVYTVDLKPKIPQYRTKPYFERPKKPAGA